MAQYSADQCLQAGLLLITKGREALRDGSGLVESDTFTHEPGNDTGLLRDALNATDAEDAPAPAAAPEPAAEDTAEPDAKA